LQFTKPHILLEEQLRNAGLDWASVLNTSDWQKFWEAGEAPTEFEMDFKFIDEWLKSNSHGTMSFLERNIDVRKDPRKILRDVSSIISIIIPYAAGHSVHRKKDQETDDSGSGIIQETARYARVPDYHRVIKKELDALMHRWQRDALAKDIIQSPVQWRVATDSLPFLDRAHARVAGLGFIGKNTMLIRPGVGSYFFVAHILVSAPFIALADTEQKKPLAAGPISELSCGDCTRCIDACPTGAIKAPMFLDATRCISYLTIEHREIIDDQFIPHLASQFYGCDICQDVCPYNLKTLPLNTILSFRKSNKYFSEITLTDVACMSQQNYEKWFGGTAMTRAKYGGLVRNALYALYALKDNSLNRILVSRKNDTDPLIAATVTQISAFNKHQPDPAQQ